MVDPRSAAQEASSIREITMSDRPSLVAALARAFYDDPVMGWFFPDDSKRLRQTERVFEFFGRKFWFPHETTYATGSLVGGAIWTPPDKWRISIPDQIRTLPQTIAAIGVRDLPRSLRGFNLMESKHPKNPPHYYLAVVGVEPEWQGKGLGTALIAPVLDICDRDGVPAYLEATSLRSRACYERSGFETTEEITLPDGPTMYAMWREPQE